MKLWLKGAKQIVQIVDNGQQFLTGEAMKKLAILEAAEEDTSAGLSIIVDEWVILSKMYFHASSSFLGERKLLTCLFLPSQYMRHNLSRVACLHVQENFGYLGCP